MMKTSILAAAAMLGVASAQQAIVLNTCSYPIFVQSWPDDFSTPGSLVELQPRGTFREDFRSTGSTIKIARDANLNRPLFFGYSFSSTTYPDKVYYEFSNEHGNPFADSHNTLFTSQVCPGFDCHANIAECYSHPPKEDKKVPECPRDTDITAHICVNDA